MRPLSTYPATLLALCLAAFLGLAPPGAAQDASDVDTPPTMADVEQAWAKGDFVAVRDGLKYLAEETGTALAQYRYGRVLVEGRGGPRDVAAAVPFLQNAADQNDPAAMTLLARVLLSGGGEQGVSDPAADAAALLSRAAALGAAEAQYYLALLHEAGTGTEQDAKAAFNWFLAAAKQDFVDAQYELSRLYSRGIGTALNPDEALAWLTRAAENGHTKAQYFLARALEEGDVATQDTRAAINWYRRAAESGLPIAQRELGTHYLRGEIVEANGPEGLRWLETAAAAGDPGAMTNLGYAYANGLTLEPDDQQAVKWYRMAKEHGLGRAMVALGAFHESGRGVEQSLDQAIALYLQALETPDAAQAALRLGQLAGQGRLDGRIAPHRAAPWAVLAARAGDADAESWLFAQAEAGVRPAQSGLAGILLADEARAAEGAELLGEAARNGDPNAQVQLGQLHMKGEHVPLDYVQAHKWFNIAAALGQSTAAELRETANALMTPEQLAEAQAAARHWFENEQPQPPKTDQSMDSE